MKSANSLWVRRTLVVLAVLAVASGFYYAIETKNNHGTLQINQWSVQLAEANQNTSGLTILSVGNIKDIREINSMVLVDDLNTVVAVSEAPMGEILLVLYSDGKLVRWDVANQERMSEFSLSFAKQGGSAFSADGSRLVSLGGIILEGDDVGDGGGYELWDTSTGDLLRCYATPACDGSKSISLDFFPLDGQLLTPNGKLLITYHNYGIDLEPMIPDYGRTGVIIFDETPKIAQVTVSPHGDYLAYAFADGDIFIQSLDEFANFDVETGTLISKESPRITYPTKLRFTLLGKMGDVRDLAFDPTNTWLAAFTEKYLVIWDLHKVLFSRHVALPVKQVDTFAFDRTGKLLAFATVDGIRVLSLDSGKQIANFEIGEVSDIYFTRDNRLLIWGDMQGKIHLWGVSK